MSAFTYRLLVTTAAVAFCSSASFAAVKHGNHSFSGGYKVTVVGDGNLGAAPSGPGGGAKGKSGGDDDDDFDLDEEVDDEDALDDILEEVENDNEDLEEDDDANVAVDDEEEVDPEDVVDGDDDPAEIAAKQANTAKKQAAAKAAKINADSDERVQNNFALKHDYLIDKDSEIKWKSAFSYGFNNQSDRHDLDRTNWAINTGPEFKFKEWGLTINPSVTYLDLNVDNNSQNQSTIGSLGASWKVTKEFALLGRYNHEFRNNQKPKSANLDVDGFTFGAKYVWGKNLFSASYSPKFENNEQFGKDKNKWGMGLGYGRKLPWKMQADLGFKYGFADFEEIAAPGRRDESYEYNVKLSKDFAYGIYSELGGVIKSKDSSIDKNDNNGKTVYLSAGWKF